MPGKMLSIQAAAEASNISTCTLRRILWRGELAFYRVGRRIMISSDDLDDFLTARHTPAKAA